MDQHWFGSQDPGRTELKKREILRDLKDDEISVRLFNPKAASDNY
jgi:hypothetical protein